VGRVARPGEVDRADNRVSRCGGIPRRRSIVRCGLSEQLAGVHHTLRIEPDFRCAERGDAQRVDQLVRESGVLEPNSCYAYLLLCEHFRDTCLVAEEPAPSTDAPAKLAGFITAYRPPATPHVVLVWQVGVAEWARRRGLGGRLLHELIRAPGARDAQYLGATISPDNAASQRLFTAFAEQIGASVERREGFTAADFGGGHEAEELYRIGPLPADRSPLQEQ